MRDQESPDVESDGALNTNVESNATNIVGFLAFVCANLCLKTKRHAIKRSPAGKWGIRSPWMFKSRCFTSWCRKQHLTCFRILLVFLLWCVQNSNRIFIGIEHFTPIWGYCAGQSWSHGHFGWFSVSRQFLGIPLRPSDTAAGECIHLDYEHIPHKKVESHVLRGESLICNN